MTNPTPEDKAVALATAYVQHHKAGDNLVWDDPGGSKTPLFTRQQIIEELAQQSGVMPDTWVEYGYFCNKCGYMGKTSEHEGCNYVAAERPSYTRTMVREAIATMQAKLEKERKEHLAAMRQLSNNHAALHAELEQVREQTRREVLEEAERHVSDLPVNKLRCSELQLTEQAWEEALEFAAREIRSLK